MIKNVSSKLYWEGKILRWERARYSPLSVLQPWSWSVRARLAQAQKFLSKNLDPCDRVLELGCGSGLLGRRIAGLCAEYRGLDIAANAIDQARRQNEFEHCHFDVGDVVEDELPPADVAVFLGLTDWLSEADLQRLFNRLPVGKILFSFTRAAQWNPYLAYRLVADHRPTQKARTYETEIILQWLEQAGFRGRIVRAPTLLNPGALMWATRD